MKRGFWMHQLAEYVLGLGAIAAGAQAPEPLFPCLAGALLLVNAASTPGPLGAFRVVPRRLHRVFDVLLVLVFVLLAALGGDRLDVSGRVVLVGVAVVLAFITWQTDYSTKPKKPSVAPADRSEQIGRTAGRVTGNAVNMWRRRTRGDGAGEP